jgi:ribosomal protein L11 methyltransferase
VKEKVDFISGFLDTGNVSIEHSEVDDEDWATSWKKYYKPVHLSEHIVIKPTWEEYIPIDGEIIVEIDPGMAFGTGTHETTIMCAQMLEKYLSKGDRVIDVGCGTGILAIIAAKLGAEHVTAVDVDGIAVRVSNENCIVNDVVDNISILNGALKDVKLEKVNVIVANIIANVIIDISKIIPYYLNKGGYFVTSGIIRDRRQEVIEAYVNLGFTCETTLEMGEWVAIVFRCQDSL